MHSRTPDALELPRPDLAAQHPPGQAQEDERQLHSIDSKQLWVMRVVAGAARVYAADMLTIATPQEPDSRLPQRTSS